MKQPSNTKIYKTALYMRLSRDDELQGESGSIQTQRMMLRQYAQEHGLTVIDEYVELRHSYAVAALQSGDNMKTIQENLGHHTAAFTLDVYGHVTEKMKRDSAVRMQKYIDILREK